MDLSTSLALLNMITMNVPVEPSAGEMEKRWENENKLKDDLFRHYDGSMPHGKNPLQIIPFLTVDHLRQVNEEQGHMTVSMTFTFTWMDERLRWNASEYGGIQGISKNRYELLVFDIWTPSLHMTDLPSSTKQSDIFMNHDVDFYIHCSGTIKATVKLLVTTPCYFGFGEYPNDYQNCSFTLMSPYYANEMQFADWGGFELSSFITDRRKITDVQDFELIGVDSQNYFMYLGLKVVDNLANFRLSHCRGYFRYNLMLKRVNKLVFAQLSIPLIAVCMFVGMSGIIPNKYGLTALVFSVGFQLLNVIHMAEILPDDYNGMPTIGVLAMFIMFETVILIVWRAFSIHVRENKLFYIDLQDVMENGQIRKSKIHDIVLTVDRVLMIVLLFQCVGNIYIIWKN